MFGNCELVRSHKLAHPLYYLVAPPLLLFSTMQNFLNRAPSTVAAAALLLLTPQALWAQAQPTAPDAARVLRESQPMPALQNNAPKAAPSIDSQAAASQAPIAQAQPSPGSAAAAKRIAVKKFLIVGLSGRSQVTEQDVLALVQEGVGKELSFAQLNALAGKVTNYFNGLGYDLARAYLPPQDVYDGQITIAVVEGRIGKVSIDNTTAYPTENLQKAIKTLQPGDVVRRQNLEQHLLLLTDVPGIDVTGVLRAGGKPGETDIVVKLRPVVTLANAVDFDNFGSKSTGINRVGVSLAVPSKTALGEQWLLRGLTTGEGMNLASLTWQTPVGGLRDKLSLSASYLHYKLGDTFASLQATGTAKTISANWTRALARDYNNSLYSSVDLARRVLDDDRAAAGSHTSKTANVLTASLNGFSNIENSAQNQKHLPGLLSYGLSYTTGHLRLDSTDSTVGAPRGAFGHLNSNVAYQQALTGRWSALLSGSSQYAAQNQDSGERMSLGGPAGVRAYGNGEGAGDRASIMTAEVRYAMNYNWQASGFYDTGFSTVQANPNTTAVNNRHLAGAGLGLQYSAPRAARIKAALAWRTTSDLPQADTDRKPRLWVNGVIYF